MDTRGCEYSLIVPQNEASADSVAGAHWHLPDVAGVLQLKYSKSKGK